MIDFCHLHLHTEYSLLDGLTRVDDAIDKALADGQKHLAITDHGNLYGLVPFYKACKAKEIHPVLGMEAYVTESMARKEKGVSTWHLILLAMNQEGLQNLYQISSSAFLQGFYYKPKTDLDFLANHSKGLIASSACLAGQIPSAILKGEDAQAIIGQYKDIFGERFYLELQPNSLPEQQIVNSALFGLSVEFDIPTIVACDAHYARREDALLHSYLWKIGTRGGKDWAPDFWMWNTQELLERGFSPEQLQRTVQIAEMCQVELPLGEKHYVKFPCPRGLTSENYLTKLALDRLLAYSHTNKINLDEYAQRLAYELSIIIPAGFADYFLVVWDYVTYAKSRDILIGPGRGSAAGSLLTFLLGITGLDPIKYELMFERFLTPGRVAMPDIDIDFSEEGKQQIVNYLIDKYGAERVALIGTLSQIGTRQAIKDVCRVLEIPNKEANQITSLVERDKSLTNAGLVSVAAALEAEPLLAEAYQQPHIKAALDVADKLIGLHRNASSHASGVVITDCPITQLTPLKREKEEEGISMTWSTQYDMNTLEELGALKYDILVLSTLDIILRVMKKVGLPIDLNAIPLDDKKTFDMLCEGCTVGVFQLSSRVMRRFCRSVKPRSIADLAIINALGRPSILDAKLDEEYLNRRDGSLPVAYMHPTLEPVLCDTYGIILYQDQALQIAVRCAGYSFLEADKLRKILGKKLKDIIQTERDKWVTGCIATASMPEDTANILFDQVAHFAAYGFNKSHGTCYGLLGYYTAYLKANYPSEFLASLLTDAAPKGKAAEDKIADIFEDCLALGVPIYPPDINRSQAGFAAEGEGIRYGTSAIAGIGNGLAEELAAGQPYGSFDALTSTFPRRKLSKARLQALIYSGALDLFGSRHILLHEVELIITKTKKRKAELENAPPSEVSKAELMFHQARVCEFAFLPELENERLDLWKDLQNNKTGRLYGVVTDVKFNLTTKPPNCKTYHRFRLQTSDAMVLCFVFDEDVDISLLQSKAIRIVRGRRSSRVVDSLVVERITAPDFG